MSHYNYSTQLTLKLVNTIQAYFSMYAQATHTSNLDKAKHKIYEQCIQAQELSRDWNDHTNTVFKVHTVITLAPNNELAVTSVNNDICFYNFYNDVLVDTELTSFEVYSEIDVEESLYKQMFLQSECIELAITQHATLLHLLNK